jgi:hypothetical protein
MAVFASKKLQLTGRSSGVDVGVRHFGVSAKFSSLLFDRCHEPVGPFPRFHLPFKFASRGDHATYKVRVPSFPYSNRFLRLLSRRYLRLAMSSALCYWDYPDRLFHCPSLTLPFIPCAGPALAVLSARASAMFQLEAEAHGKEWT